MTPLIAYTCMGLAYFVGLCVGVVAASLCVTAKRSDHE